MTQIKGLVSGTVALMLSGTAFGGSSVTVNIERQGMAGALSEFAKQSGMQLLYPSDGQVERLMAKEVVGTYPAEIALSQLLEDSGLKYQFVNARTVAIAPRSDDALNDMTASYSSAADRTQAINTHEATADQPMKVEPSGVPSGETTAQRGVPEILVRGTRSLNADIERTPDDIQPYIVFSKKQIERSGAPSIEKLLKDQLTMNYVPYSSGEQSAVGGGTQSQFALRGLSVGETLILVDGRRLGSRGIDGAILQPDLNAIPLSAVERIEVLPASGSGLYGGSATAGVINIILRRNYSGIEGSVTYETTSRNDATNRRVDISGSVSLSDRTTLFLRGSHSDQGDLKFGDRVFAAEYHRQIAENGGSSALVIPLGYTPNIRSNTFVGGVRQDLVLKPEYGGHSLGSPIAHIPPGYAGVSSDGGAGLQESAGRYNSDLAQTAQVGGAHGSLVAPASSQSGLMTLRHRFSDRWEAFLEVLGAKSHSAYRRTALSGTFRVPAEAPTNPFQQEIVVVTPILGNHDSFRSEDSAYRALIGVIADLGAGWRTEVDFSFDRNDYHQVYPSTLFLDTINTAIQLGEIDLLKDVNIFPVDLASYVAPPSVISPTHSIQKDGTIRLAGPLFSMPAGRPTLSTLIEKRDSKYGKFQNSRYLRDGNIESSIVQPQSASVWSISSEIRIPIFSESYRLPGIRHLELQIAGRYDNYRQVPGRRDIDVSPPERIVNRESSFDSTFGIRMSPAPGVMVRASYATGFAPPSLMQLVPEPPVVISAAHVTDPKRGGEALGDILYRMGGRDDLKPERSVSRSLGLVIEPTDMLQSLGKHLNHRLRVSFDWTEIEKRDNIVANLLSSELMELEDQFPIVVRAPKLPGDPYEVGPVIEVDGRYLNAARAVYRSYDLSIDYEYTTESFGTWALRARGTRMLTGSSQITLTADPVDRVGTLTMPEWRANATLEWRLGSFGVFWAARYMDSYWINTDHSFSPLQGGSKVPSEVYHDVGMDLSIGKGPGLLSNTGIRLGIKNVFDQEPRFYAQGQRGYDPWGDPRMATYYLTISKEF